MALNKLQREWWLLGLIGALAVAWFASVQPWQAALVSAAVLVYQLWILRGDLVLNCAKGGRLRAGFGAGTWLSAFRLVLLSLLAGLLVVPRPAGWFAFWLALAFNLSDLFDGYLARRSGGGTQLGAKLDMDLDGRGVLVVSLLAVSYGQASFPFVLAGLARYVYVAALWLYRLNGGRLQPLAANPLRRPFAGVQMGVATALLSPLFSPPATSFVATLTLFPFLTNFFIDWLQVTGRLKPATAKRWVASLKPLALIAVMALRFAVALALLYRAWVFGIYSLAGTVDLLAALYLLFGIAGRPVALLALITTAARLNGAAITPLDYGLLFGLTALMYLGLGRWQLWQPELDFLTRRLRDTRRA